MRRQATGPRKPPSIRQQLWARQNGLCAHCGKPLPVKGSHRHHRKPGSKRLADLELLHPRCHLIHKHGRKAGK